MWKKTILTVLVIIGIAILVAYVAFAMAMFTQVLYNTMPLLGYISFALMAAVIVTFMFRGI